MPDFGGAVMQEQSIPDERIRDERIQDERIQHEGRTPDESRAEDLKDRAGKTARAHQGNRATADMDQPQPTREPTRDQR
jgi:hypothetical protein